MCRFANCYPKAEKIGSYQLNFHDATRFFAGICTFSDLHICT